MRQGKGRAATAPGLEAAPADAGGAPLPAGPTPERAAKGAFELVTRREADPDGSGRRPITQVWQDAASTTLRRLHRAGTVDARLVEAGERYWRDWYLAGMERRITMDWDRSPRAGAASDWSATQVDAMARLTAARTMLLAAGPVVIRVVDAVILEGETLGAAPSVYARDKARAAANAGLLVAGLGLLATHYGL